MNMAVRFDTALLKERVMPRSRLRRFLLIGGIPLLAVAGLFFVPRALALGFHGRHNARTVEELREHMEHRADFVLDRLDASDAQRDKVNAILDQNAPQFFALMSEGRNVRVAMKNALLADKVDRAKLEKAQADLDALADKASELGVETLAQVAEVLTPAQRQKIAEHLADLHRP
jgi:protein CpxP